MQGHMVRRARRDRRLVGRRAALRDRRPRVAVRQRGGGAGVRDRQRKGGPG